jgi:periplasmic divalent cation tolerance protein
MATDIRMVLTTCPDANTAQQVTTALVTERMAACVNDLPGVQSTYLWKAQPQRGHEVLLWIKATATQLATLELRLKVLHPYRLSAFAAVTVCAGSQSYLVGSGKILHTLNKA